MKKWIKPIAFLFAVALSTGAYAQQGKINSSLKVNERPAKLIQEVPKQERRTKKRAVNGYLRSQIVNEQGRTRYKVKADK
jgi:hypothetical protein